MRWSTFSPAGQGFGACIWAIRPNFTGAPGQSLCRGRLGRAALRDASPAWVGSSIGLAWRPRVAASRGGNMRLRSLTARNARRYSHDVAICTVGGDLGDRRDAEVNSIDVFLPSRPLRSARGAVQPGALRAAARRGAP